MKKINKIQKHFVEFSNPTILRIIFIFHSLNAENVDSIFFLRGSWYGIFLLCRKTRFVTGMTYVVQTAYVYQTQTHTATVNDWIIYYSLFLFWSRYSSYFSHFSHFARKLCQRHDFHKKRHKLHQFPLLCLCLISMDLNTFMKGSKK